MIKLFRNIFKEMSSKSNPIDKGGEPGGIYNDYAELYGPDTARDLFVKEYLKLLTQMDYGIESRPHVEKIVGGMKVTISQVDEDFYSFVIFLGEKVRKKFDHENQVLPPNQNITNNRFFFIVTGDTPQLFDQIMANEKRPHILENVAAAMQRQSQRTYDI